MTVPPLTRTRAPATSGARTNFGSTAPLWQTAGKTAAFATVAMETGGQIRQQVKNETNGGKPAYKAWICETVDVGATRVAEIGIRTGVAGAALTLGTLEPWALVPAAPLLADTWNRSSSTAQLFGDSSREACYSLLGDKKF
jgi:hypothetical protein